MKKLRSNGGYSLVYVVVAMTLILAIVGGLGLTASRNLASQQQAVDRLKARYDAAGKIEKIYGIEVKYPTTSPSSTSNPSSVRPMSAGGGSGIDWESLLKNFWDTLDNDTQGKLKEWLGELLQSATVEAIETALKGAFTDAFKQLERLGIEIDAEKIGELTPVFDNADKSVTFPGLPLISSSEVGENGVRAIVDAKIDLTFNVNIQLDPISITCSVNNITYKSYSVTYSDGTTEEGADT